jgi:hypothetical protein
LTIVAPSNGSPQKLTAPFEVSAKRFSGTAGREPLGKIPDYREQ